jgi:hypothetical protein
VDLNVLDGLEQLLTHEFFRKWKPRRRDSKACPWEERGTSASDSGLRSALSDHILHVYGIDVWD